jgi:hypothetical protein
VSEDARLALVRELERADEEVAAVLAELDELYGAVEEVRSRALELEAFFERLPAERAGASATVEERDRALARAEAIAADSATELRRAEADGNPERIASAQRFAVRARDSASAASRLVGEARAAAELLEKRVAAAEQEAPAVERRARGLAASLRSRPRLVAEAGVEPRPGLEGVSEWAGSARASLLVARSGLAGERDGTIRQANELAALVLGEPLAAVGTSAVARRLERELGGR